MTALPPSQQTDGYRGEPSARAAKRMKVEVCPVCGNGPNVAGTKYCYGRASTRHDKARWEWVEVVAVRDLLDGDVPELMLSALCGQTDAFEVTADDLRRAITTALSREGSRDA